MACTTTCAYAFSLSSPRYPYSILNNSNSHNSSGLYFLTSTDCRRMPLLFCSITKGRTPYKNTLIFEAVQLLGPPARFQASKLKVDFAGDETYQYSRVVPRLYILSHCDFTANLSLTISNIINIDQLQGWYSKDDVVAEWKEVQGHLYLVVHCYVSGPNRFLDLAAEFRYHIFSKELPLVLQAVLYGDSALFKEHPGLMDAVVWVYFHSSSPKYNHVECWGPLKDAAQVDQDTKSLLATDEKDLHRQKWGSSKSFLQALFTFLL